LEWNDDVIDNFLERRAPVRQAHLELVQQAHDGELLMAGSFRDPVDGSARGSNPQLQPWEGDGPFLYSVAADNPLRMSIHPHFRARPRGLRQSPSADQVKWTVAI
jgi:hypothetical protein